MSERAGEGVWVEDERGGSGARSCFDQLPNSKDWVKAFFMNNDSVSASVCVDRRFNYTEKSSLGDLDGGTTHAQYGMAKLND
ncbi:hypothetical protein [Paenibacillus sp. RS8]|uniref:hypothetical protein n=1 Tax=Paenibacillus sp. RS8 TaxID=3242681 RepID=UPI0035C22DD7